MVRYLKLLKDMLLQNQLPPHQIALINDQLANMTNIQREICSVFIPRLEMIYH
jgi:hypothetical protein